MEKLLSLEESAPHAWAVEKSAVQCNPATTRFFLFYIKKKIKISKIYVRFEKFQKYPRSPPP
jgi:hypothetical protein